MIWWRVRLQDRLRRGLKAFPLQAINRIRFRFVSGLLRPRSGSFLQPDHNSIEVSPGAVSAGAEALALARLFGTTEQAAEKVEMSSLPPAEAGSGYLKQELRREPEGSLYPFIKPAGVFPQLVKSCPDTNGTLVQLISAKTFARLYFKSEYTTNHSRRMSRLSRQPKS
jgi:hypothetical protein